MLITLLSLCLMFMAHAEDGAKHMVMVTTQGVGASIGYEKFDPGPDSRFDRFDITQGNFALNYHYTLIPQFQVGGFISNFSEEREFKVKNGSSGEVVYHTLIFGISALWNFSQDLQSAYYAGMTIAYLNHEEEYAKGVFDFIEDDRNATTFEWLFGKRFQLTKWGLANITYSPNVSLFVRESTKDYSDDKLKNSVGLNLQILKFDVLF